MPALTLVLALVCALSAILNVVLVVVIYLDRKERETAERESSRSFTAPAARADFKILRTEPRS